MGILKAQNVRAFQNSMDFLEYPGVSAEMRGAMVGGFLKLSDSEVIFKHGKTGRKDVVKVSLCRRAIHNIVGFLVLRIYVI